VIVVLIHEGVTNPGDFNNPRCEGLTGALIPILDRLDPAIDVVVSGHTHQAYVCDYGLINPAKPILLTSAGSFGRLVTGIDLKVDPASGRVLSKSARNIVVQSEAFSGARGAVPLVDAYPKFTPRADVAALVARYRDAAKAELMEKLGHAETALLDGFVVKAATVKAIPDTVITAEMVGDTINGRKSYRRFAVKETV
jgi:5'-nucleotidase